jgi:hypothetical protein
MDETYDNSYHRFYAAGMDFLVIALEVGPTDDMLNWAQTVISQHPGHRVILVTHNYVSRYGTHDTECYYLPGDGYDGGCARYGSNTGVNIWNKLVKNPDNNIDFVFSGHHAPEEYPDIKDWLESDGVYQFLCGEWYNGWLKILTFVPREDKVYFKTYSPWACEDPSHLCTQDPFRSSVPGYNTDPNCQFELDYYMK